MIRLACILMLVAAPAGAVCRLALALGIDVSRSVDARDYAIQREGVLAALADPVIVDAFLKPRDDVALAVFEWSGQAYQEIVVDWVLIRTEVELSEVLDRISSHQRGGEALPTGLGSALVFGRDLFARAPNCDARTLDMSGDGRSNDGRSPAEIYAREDFGDILVNGLPIGGHEADVAVYYREQVIRGPGAFIEIARTQADFPRAFRRKLERELTEQLFGERAPGHAPG